MESTLQNEKTPFFNTPKSMQLNADSEIISDEVTGKYADLADVVKMASRQSVEFVKKYPVYSVLGAAAVGMVIGSMIRKKIL